MFCVLVVCDLFFVDSCSWCVACCSLFVVGLVSCRCLLLFVVWRALCVVRCLMCVVVCSFLYVDCCANSIEVC